MGKSAAGPDFDRLLDRAEKLLGEKQNVAKAIGIKPPRYSRIRQGADRYGLSVPNCFRLARVLRETPQRVLRAAGKAQFADELDEFFGPSAGAPTVPIGLEWIDAISVPAVSTVAKAMTQLPESAQFALAALAEEMAQLREGRQPEQLASGFSPGSTQVRRTKSGRDPRR